MQAGKLPVTGTRIGDVSGWGQDPRGRWQKSWVAQTHLQRKGETSELAQSQWVQWSDTVEAFVKAKAGSLGNSCSLPPGSQRHTHKQVEQNHIYFEPAGALPRWSRAPNNCSHMARDRGTWKQPLNGPPLMVRATFPSRVR